MKSFQTDLLSFCIFVFLVVLLCDIPQALGSESLIGGWVSEKPSRGGIRNIHYYTEDGTLISRLSVMLGFFYQLTDDMLLLTPADGDNENPQPQKYTIQLDGNSLTLTDETKGSTEYLWREPSKTATEEQSGLLGTWLFKHPTGATGAYTFRPDGRVFFQIPLPGETVSQYSIEGDEILLRTGNSTERMKFTVRGETLTLWSADGKKEYKYRKSKPIE